MKLTWPPPNRSAGMLDGLGLMGLVGLVIARFIPVARWVPFWGCSLRRATGWPCPGCGLTRAADRFAHGDFHGALDANPLGTVAAAVLAVLAVWTVLHLAFKVPTPDLTLTAREGRWARNAAILLALLNYAYVVVRTRHPEWL